MVKSNGASQASKSLSGKKGSGCGKGNTTPASNPGNSKSTSKRSQLSLPSCSNCGILVAEDTKALQCDRCQAPSTWKCLDCLSITGKLYDKLASDTANSLRWFCDRCKSVVMNKSASAEEHGDKLDQLITIIEKMMLKYDSIEQSLLNKCDTGSHTCLDTRIKAIEDKMSKLESSWDRNVSHTNTVIENRLSCLESRLNAVENLGDNFKDQAVADEELIKCAVEVEVKKQAEEKKTSSLESTM